MKVYKEHGQAIVLLLNRLVKNGTITQKEAEEVCGSPLDKGAPEYPKGFLEFYDVYPMSGEQANKKTGFKKKAYASWLSHGFGEDQERAEKLIKAARKYKTLKPDGDSYIARIHNFIDRDTWLNYVEEDETPIETVFESESW